MTLQFSIGGGACGVAYDVFANSVLSFGPNGVPWAWMGQGYPYNTYTLTGLPNTTGFLILGTPFDPDGDGLTEAYEWLVSKTNPFSPGSDPDGIPNGWEALLGLTGQNYNPGQSSLRANYGYTAADWLNGVTGIKSGSVTNDPEGNVIQVSQ